MQSMSHHRAFCVARAAAAPSLPSSPRQGLGFGPQSNRSHMPCILRCQGSNHSLPSSCDIVNKTYCQEPNFKVLLSRLSFLPLQRPCPCFGIHGAQSNPSHVYTVLCCQGHNPTLPLFEPLLTNILVGKSTLVLYFMSRVTLTSFLPLVPLSSMITCQEIKSGCFALTEILFQTQ